jgi:hypothetical protein
MVAQPRHTYDALGLRIHSGAVIPRRGGGHSSLGFQIPLKDWSEAR